MTTRPPSSALIEEVLGSYANARQTLGYGAVVGVAKDFGNLGLRGVIP